MFTVNRRLMLWQDQSRSSSCLGGKGKSSLKDGIKVGTHEGGGGGISPCNWSLRLVPCSVYTKEIVAGTSPLKGDKREPVNSKIAKFKVLLLKFAET